METKLKYMFSASVVTVLLGTGAAIAANSMSGMDMGKNEAAEWVAFGEPGKAANITRTINIAAGEMFFDPEKVTAKVGDTLRFVVTNKGKKDHEFVIGDLAFQQQHMKEMVAMPGMEMDEPNELQLKPGETKSVIWNFTKAGDFMFACDIPTHADLGMEGDLVVR